MSTREEIFEIHKRKIAMLGKEGLINTLEQEFTSSSSVNPVKSFADPCPICGRPFVNGYAVRCTKPECASLIFHAECFGTHALRTHQPASVTVIVKETGPNVVTYVDVVARSIPQKTIDVAKKTEIPSLVTSGTVVVDSAAYGTISSQDPTQANVQVPVPPSTPATAVSEAEDRARAARELRTERMKRRSQGRSTRNA